MWIVIKYKINQLNILKDNLKKILGNEPEYFIPKIRYDKIVKNNYKTLQKSILEGYLLCFHSKFINKNLSEVLKYTKGVSLILDGFKNSQSDILNFIKRCQTFQDKEGFITQEFFHNKNFTKGKFISGPFTNFVFEILSRNKDKIEIMIGRYRTIISEKTDLLYRPI
tara:strand:+ start:493 stop:993 length:501 start_codon:yes stop_codon:yes gene_type:complete